MSQPYPDVLGADARPLCFAVANADAIGLSLPAARGGTSVRTWARALAGMQKEAITLSDPCGVAGAAWRFVSDEGPYLAGHDAGPCPLSFFTTGMAASYMNAIVDSARLREVGIRDVRLVLDNRYSMAGSVLAGTMTGGAIAPELAVEIDSDAPVSVLSELVTEAVRSAPVASLLAGVHESLFALSHNGSEVAPQRVRQLCGVHQADPAGLFSAVDVADEAAQPLVHKLVEAERVEHAVGGVNTSLKESQDRQLHCRGVCTIREDGMRQVDQTLLKPIGSSFRFLSEEPAKPGVPGRAPDALSYVSAGIAFCFMTQFGRYAEIRRRRLDACAIVQDSFFSWADAGGGRHVSEQRTRWRHTSTWRARTTTSSPALPST